MAINTITYANKSDINANSSVSTSNKIQATDMNEIKTVVNSNATLMGDVSTLTGSTDIVDYLLDKTYSQLLWTNPNMSNAFSGQDVTLSSSSYDELEIIYYNWNSQKYFSSTKAKKGDNLSLQCMIRNGTYGYIGVRNVTYVNDTKLTFSDSYTLVDGNQFSTATNNQWNVPIYIIGHTTGLWS